MALDQLGAIIKQCLANLSLPHQTLLSIMCLLGKKLGGSRNIAILASLYRIIMKVLGGHVREWDLATGHAYDSALAGCSSLQAAVTRALKVENGIVSGLNVGHLLWDMEKFYDTVPLPILAEELTKRDYPPVLLTIGLLAHTAPRVLKVGKCHSATVADTGNSMLAGCLQSV